MIDSIEILVSAECSLAMRCTGSVRVHPPSSPPTMLQLNRPLARQVVSIFTVEFCYRLWLCPGTGGAGKILNDNLQEFPPTYATTSDFLYDYVNLCDILAVLPQLIECVRVNCRVDFRCATRPSLNPPPSNAFTSGTCCMACQVAQRGVASSSVKMRVLLSALSCRPDPAS